MIDAGRFKHADDLRMAVKEVICDNGKERRKYEEALIAITVEEPLERLVCLPITFSFCEIVLLDFSSFCLRSDNENFQK